jgi:hypothetical protein
MDDGDNVDQEDTEHQSLIEADSQAESFWSLLSATVSLDQYPGCEKRILFEYDIDVKRLKRLVDFFE